MVYKNPQSLSWLRFILNHIIHQEPAEIYVNPAACVSIWSINFIKALLDLFL